MEIVYQEMPAGTVLDKAMPDWVKIEMATCIILFGRLEQKAIEIAWDMAGTVEVKERVKRARQPASNNFDEILAVIEEAAGEKFEALRNAFEGLANDRNFMVHGHWLMAGEKPYVVWHKFITDADSVMGEYFEKHRFEHFQRRGEKLLDTFKRWHDMLSDQKSVLDRVPAR